MDDETPRFSDRGVQSLIAETLVSVFKRLDELGDTPHVRELRARARSYERIIANWSTVPPSGPQRDATFDLVIELHAKLGDLKKRHAPPVVQQHVVCERCGRKSAGQVPELLALGWSEASEGEWACPGCVVTKPTISKRARR